MDEKRQISQYESSVEIGFAFLEALRKEHS